MVHERDMLRFIIASAVPRIIRQHLSPSWEARFKDGLRGSDESHLHARLPSSQTEMTNDNRCDTFILLRLCISRKTPLYVTRVCSPFVIYLLRGIGEREEISEERLIKIEELKEFVFSDVNTDVST